MLKPQKKIFDFIISKNIFHQSRIAYNCSNEDLIICVNSTGDAEQIIEFINNDSFLADNLLKVNPFLPQKNGVGITINTKKSFTETLSQIIANFCKERGREYLNTDNLNNYINLLNFFESIKTERNEDLSNIYSILETTTTKFSENDPYDIVKKKSEFVNIMPQIKDYLNKNAIPYLNDEEGIKLYFKDILEKLKNQSQQQETNQENIELETVVQNLTLISMEVKRLEDQIIQLQENIRRLNTRDLNYQAKKDEYQKGIEEITAFLKIPLAKIKQTIYQFLSDYQKTNEEGFTM